MSHLESDFTLALRGVSRVGHAFLPAFRPRLSTEEVARVIGSLVDISRLLPGSEINAVQQLTPREPSATNRNQYSGTFGLGVFPLHTDLAHWARPPRYLLLRCIRGARDVRTLILPAERIEEVSGSGVVRRAVVRPRRANRRRVCLPLPLRFTEGQDTGFRWDSLFLTPVNECAAEIAQAMSAIDWRRHGLVECQLAEPGDTLLLDNWHCLHGRSAVQGSDVSRRIERAYFSSLVL